MAMIMCMEIKKGEAKQKKHLEKFKAIKNPISMKNNLTQFILSCD